MSSRNQMQAISQVDADRVSDHLELLADMGLDFAASLDIEATLEKALARITDHLDAEGGALFLLDDAGETLTCKVCVGPVDITGLTLERGQGIVGRCVTNNAGEIVRDVASDPGFAKTVDEKTGFTTRSILCAPMSVHDERIGAIELVNRKGGDGLFEEDDLNFLQGLSSSAALAILNARMAEALVEQERVRRELELAAEIQRSLLPEPRPYPFPVCGVNRPARTVSGDFYDFFSLEDGRICFNLGDVSGKGMNAALMMAKTSSLFRCLGKTIHAPGRLLARINAEISETTTRGMFVTMVGGIYDPVTGVVRLSNAGHEPPLFIDGAGTFSTVPAESPPLGLHPLLADGQVFPETELRLDGGTLYVFTDGLTEGYTEDGRELGVAGLKAMLAGNAGLDLGARLESVIDRIDRGGALRDDITILAIDDAGRSGTAGKAMEKDPKSAEYGIRVMRLVFPSHPDRLKAVRGAVSDALAKVGCSREDTRDLVIAVDEACQNVIRHAYRERTDGEIVLEIFRDGDRIVVLLRDFADTVDAAKVRPRPLDEIRPGGLGTHLMAEVMDEVRFLDPPEGGGNLLRMTKRIGVRGGA